MPRATPTIADVLATFRFASAELGSEEAGMAVAMRAFALSRANQVERRPHQVIIDCVAEHFGVTVDDLLGPGIKRHVAKARRAAQWLLHANGYTYQDAAEFTGRKTNAEALRSCRAVDGDEALLAELGRVAGMIEDRLPMVKRAPVVWPKARTV